MGDVVGGMLIAVPGNRLLFLVAFDDIGKPESARGIDAFYAATDIAVIIGSGYSLQPSQPENTKEPITNGDVSKVVKMVNAQKNNPSEKPCFEQIGRMAA